MIGAIILMKNTKLIEGFFLLWSIFWKASKGLVNFWSILVNIKNIPILKLFSKNVTSEQKKWKCWATSITKCFFSINFYNYVNIHTFYRPNEIFLCILKKLFLVSRKNHNKKAEEKMNSTFITIHFNSNGFSEESFLNISWFIWKWYFLLYKC